LRAVTVAAQECSVSNHASTPSDGGRARAYGPVPPAPVGPGIDPGMGIGGVGVGVRVRFGLRLGLRLGIGLRFGLGLAPRFGLGPRGDGVPNPWSGMSTSIPMPMRAIGVPIRRGGDAARRRSTDASQTRQDK
jgi:hypothetical protein